MINTFLLHICFVTEIDECSESAGLCGTGSCQNTKGAYMCNCPAGFEFTDGTCSSVYSLLDVIYTV